PGFLADPARPISRGQSAVPHPLSTPPFCMKKLIAATLLAATGLLAHQANAQATVRPESSEQARKGKKANARKASGEDIARMQQRMSMNPHEAKRDQQMEVLEARAGGTANTSFGRASGPARQME